MPGTVYGDHLVEGGQGHPDTRLIAHDDTEELGNLCGWQTPCLGSVARKWTVLYQREWGGVLLPTGLEYAPAGRDQAKLDIDKILEPCGRHC